MSSVNKCTNKCILYKYNKKESWYKNMLNKEIIMDKINSDEFIYLYKLSYKSVLDDLIKFNNLNLDNESILCNIGNTINDSKVYIEQIIEKYINREFDNHGILYVLNISIKYERIKNINNINELKKSTNRIASMNAARLILKRYFNV